jgi:hypothetical protein
VAAQLSLALKTPQDVLPPCHTWDNRPVISVSGVFRSALSLIVYEVGTDEVIIHYVRQGARRRPWEGE